MKKQWYVETVNGSKKYVSDLAKELGFNIKKTLIELKKLNYIIKYDLRLA